MPTVLVTGSSRGIGKATAAALRARGANVIGHASRPGGDENFRRDFSGEWISEPPNSAKLANTQHA